MYIYGLMSHKVESAQDCGLKLGREVSPTLPTLVKYIITPLAVDFLDCAGAEEQDTGKFCCNSIMKFRYGFAL